MENEPEEVDEPTAEASLGGDADSTVIEAGGEDNSTEIDTTTDESVNVSVVVEAPEETAAETVAYIDRAEFESYKAEHNAIHQNIDERLAQLLAIDALLAAEDEVEEVEPVVEAAPSEPIEEMQPKRNNNWWYRPLMGRSET